MNTRFSWLLMGLSFIVVGGPGCCHRCRQSCAPPCPPAACPSGIPNPALGTLPPHPLTPAAVAPVVPPAQSVTPPPPAPPAGSNETHGYGPATPPPSAAITGPATPAPQPPSVRLTPPDATPPGQPSGSEAAALTPALPVAIPQFASVLERVASGLRPLPGGFDWLAANGFRTVLHIRKPGEDDAADRTQVEKLGVKFLSLEVSPQTLSKTTVDEFNRLVGDSSVQPLFIYDGDGVLAGGLWYLHFRTVLQMTDDAARAKAIPLGLKDTTAGEPGTMWVAIQKFLSAADGSRP